MVIKFPRNGNYAAQPLREQNVLSSISQDLPLICPKPIAMGNPNEDYPFHWSILNWIEGETLAHASHPDPDAPRAIARFLRHLHRPAHADAPVPGPENLWRGGPLSALEIEFSESLKVLPDISQRGAIISIWRDATDSTDERDPCWVHGDIAPSNILQSEGRLRAVIDFGLSCAGDPACDLAIGWLAFDADQRMAFLSEYDAHDKALVDRGRVWALWKAVLVSSGKSASAPGYHAADTIIKDIINEVRHL